MNFSSRQNKEKLDCTLDLFHSARQDIGDMQKTHLRDVLFDPAQHVEEECNSYPRAVPNGPLLRCLDSRPHCFCVDVTL